MIENLPLARCTCGQLYSSEGWERAALVGYVPSGRDAAGELLETRLCESCGERLYLDCGEQPDPHSAASLGRIAAQLAYRRTSPTMRAPARSIPPHE